MGIMGNLVLFCGAMLRKAGILNELYTKDYFKRLKALFSTVHGISWVLPVLWKEYRQRKVRQFIKIAEEGKSIKFFNRTVVRQVYNYMESFVAVLGNVKSLHYTTYDVEWESDMSYYIAVRFEARGIDTKVLIDLHSNTALFAEVPLPAICAPYGSNVHKEVYQALISPENNVRKSGSVFLKKGEVTIEVNGKAKTLTVGEGKKVPLEDFVVTANESYSTDFKQYAYLWEHFDQAFFQYTNESHRKMYLSNLLNAKNAFFSIIEAGEREIGERVAHPKTILVSRREKALDLGDFSERVVVKEGGWCSTGGKQVEVVSKGEIEKVVRDCNYEGITLQNYTASIFFTLNGTPMHGHIRNASIIKRNGEIVDAGFVLKLIEQEKCNSSGYRSHMLYFDESGKFVFGQGIGGGTEPYTRLEQVGLIPTVNLQEIFREVRTEWEKAMYGVNKFVCENNMLDFARELAESGKLSKRYLINTH
jgi:hypothetical protein